MNTDINETKLSFHRVRRFFYTMSECIYEEDLISIVFRAKCCERDV